MTSSSTLSGEVYFEHVRRRRSEHRVPCPFAPAAPDDAYAPVRFAPRCVDSTGYGRRHHDFSVVTRRGVECLFCGKVRG